MILFPTYWEKCSLPKNFLYCRIMFQKAWKDWPSLKRHRHLSPAMITICLVQKTIVRIHHCSLLSCIWTLNLNLYTNSQIHHSMQVRRLHQGQITWFWIICFLRLENKHVAQFWRSDSLTVFAANILLLFFTSLYEDEVLATIRGHAYHKDHVKYTWWLLQQKSLQFLELNSVSNLLVENNLWVV